MNPVDDFLAEKEKQAGWLSAIGDAFKRGLGGAASREGATFGQAMAHGLGQAAPGVALASGVAAAGLGIQKGVGALKEKYTKAKDYQGMLEANPVLRKEPAGHVQLMYNSLRKLAPSIAKEPLVAGSYVRQMLASSPEAGPAVPIATAKLLAETQRNISQSSESRGLPGFDLRAGDFPKFGR